MTEKRMSTRNRGEPPLKKRALTPTPPPPPRSAAKSAKAPPPPEPPEIKEEGLPIKLVEDRPLPTVLEPQSVKLSTKAFQSISESGVLAASIERSKQRWLTDGIFEKYWTRPLRKTVPNLNNPPKETMSKLGTCSLIIEPHIFDITLYTVKDLLPAMPMTYHNIPPPPSHYSPFPQNPTYAPPVYSGPFTGTTDSPSHNPFTPFKENFNRPGTHAPPPAKPYTPPSSSQAGTPGPPQVRQASSSSKGITDNAQSDPVIQILATRAASDTVLKNLMKVVASGQANPDQLKEFQSHIDEINTSLKNRRNSHSRKSSTTSKHPTPDDPLPSVEVNSSPPAPAPARPALPPTNKPPRPPSVPFKAEPLPQIYPPAPPLQYQQKPKPLATRPDIHSIVFDFSTTSDRFLIPRLSIAEYHTDLQQVIISFLVIRKGSTAASPSKYNKNRSYYQPVTIKLKCSTARILEPIARVLAPQEEVRRYMDGVFDKMLPAESVFLATRLPRTKDGDVSDDEEVEEHREKSEELVKARYDPPSSLVPMAA